MLDLGSIFRYTFDEVHRGMVVQEAVVVSGLLDEEGSAESRGLASRISTHLAERLEEEFEFSHEDLALLSRALRDAELVPGSGPQKLRAMLAPHSDDD